MTKSEFEKFSDTTERLLNVLKEEFNRRGTAPQILQCGTRAVGKDSIFGSGGLLLGGPPSRWPGSCRVAQLPSVSLVRLRPDFGQH